MRQLLLYLLLSCPLFCFGQRSLRTLTERVALLQVYLELAQRGYRTVQNGLETVREITNGEFSLHTLFQDRLKKVNPILRQYPSVVKSFQYHHHALRIYRETKVISASLLPAEQKVLLQLGTEILASMQVDIDLLTVLLQDESFSMGDAARMATMESIEVKLKEKYALLYEQFEGTKVFINQRKQALK